MARLRRPTPLFALLVIGYLLYAGAFILRTSPTIDANSYILETKRYYVLFDDMMISMRYARHWAEGHGLVWNLTGERVEGFTNPGWVAWMALWHRVGLDDSKTSLPILISGAVFMALTMIVVRRIGERLSGNPWVGIGAALFTGFYLPLNIWSLRGTEVSILTLVLAWATLLTLRAFDAGRVPWGAYVLLGASTAIRMDMAVPLGALTAFMMFNDRSQRGRSGSFWRHALIGVVMLVLFMGPQIALRRWYYGEWLPNTYYLKMAGYPLVLRILEGLEIFIRLFVRFGPLPFGIFLFRQDRAVRLLAWFATAQMLYSIYVGGDAWEDIGGANRYFALGMPHLFLLLMLTLAAFYQGLRAAGETVMSGPRPTARSLRIGMIILIPSLLVITNYLSTTDSLPQLLLLKPERYSGESQIKVESALLLDALTTPDATVALSGVGVIPYFTERTYIDILGKVDKTIARLPADRQYMPDYKPGHMKWDYAYSIGQLQPDVILEVWLDDQSAYAAMNGQYETVWFPPMDRLIFMRVGSPHIYWDRLR